MLVTDSDGRVRALEFDDHEDRLHLHLQRHYSATGFLMKPGSAPRDVVARIEAFFSGDVTSLGAIDVATGGTPFQQQVWTALRRIPIGTTMVYGQLAAMVGRPDASRAVGAANGANPVALIVPCHRVIGANGDLTGYAGGIERKRWLLAHERASLGLFQSEIAKLSSSTLSTGSTGDFDRPSR